MTCESSHGAPVLKPIDSAPPPETGWELPREKVGLGDWDLVHQPRSQLEMRAPRWHPAVLRHNRHVSKMPQATPTKHKVEKPWSEKLLHHLWTNKPTHLSSHCLQLDGLVWVSVLLHSAIFQVLSDTAGWGAECIVLRIRVKMIKVLYKPKDADLLTDVLRN